MKFAFQTGENNMEWINKMNEMFENNPYTDSGRMKVEVDVKHNTTTITIYPKVCVIENINRFTEVGLMLEIFKVISNEY